jgi:hypothetical protein
MQHSTESQDGQAHELGDVVTYAESEAQRLMDSADTAPLDVVVWLSAHLAAMERAVYPTVKRRLPDGAVVVAAHRGIAGRLNKTLRVVERHHSGDLLAAGLDPVRMMTNLRELVDEHHDAQVILVERLSRELSAADREAMANAYEAALEHAPTRPHSHLPRSAVMFRIDALRDKILDTMDGRHVPVPRIPRQWFTPGRWGSYLLGQPHDHAADDPRRDVV